MSFLDIFIDSLNAISIIFIIMFCLVGVMIGILLKPPRANRVIKFLRGDKRFIEFDVDKEMEYSIYCKDLKGFPPHRFIKYHSGFTGKVGMFVKRAATIFLGVSGTAYTQTLISGEQAIDRPLVQCLRDLWGKTFYEQIPQEQRDMIDPVMLTTIDLGEHDQELKPISPQVLVREQAEQSSQFFLKGRKVAEKGQWVNYLFIAGTGAAVMLVGAILLGWVKIGG